MINTEKAEKYINQISEIYELIRNRPYRAEEALLKLKNEIESDISTYECSGCDKCGHIVSQHHHTPAGRICVKGVCSCII